MEKNVPDTKHTQQDNISFTQAARLTALTTASDQPWITLHCLTMSGYTLPGWSFTAPLCTVSLRHTSKSDNVWHEVLRLKTRAKHECIPEE